MHHQVVSMFAKLSVDISGDDDDDMKHFYTVGNSGNLKYECMQ